MGEPWGLGGLRCPGVWLLQGRWRPRLRFGLAPWLGLGDGTALEPVEHHQPSAGKTREAPQHPVDHATALLVAVAIG